MAKKMRGLGLVDFLILPHWGNDRVREKYFGFRLKHAYQPENKLILLNDFQYVKVEGNMYRIVDVREKK